MSNKEILYYPKAGHLLHQRIWAQQSIRNQLKRNTLSISLQNLQIPQLNDDHKYRTLIARIQSFNQLVQQFNLGKSIAFPSQSQQIIVETIVKQLNFIRLMSTHLQISVLQNLYDWVTGPKRQKGIKLLGSILYSSNSSNELFLQPLKTKQKTEATKRSVISTSQINLSADQFHDFQEFLYKNQPALTPALQIVKRKNRLYKLKGRFGFPHQKQSSSIPKKYKHLMSYLQEHLNKWCKQRQRGIPNITQEKNLFSSSKNSQNGFQFFREELQVNKAIKKFSLQQLLSKKDRFLPRFILNQTTEKEKQADFRFLLLNPSLIDNPLQKQNKKKKK